MRKLIRNILLVVLLISFLVVPAYGESDKVEHPIIIIAAGEPIPEYIQFIHLFERAEVTVDILYDLHTRIAPELFSYFLVVNNDFEKYKTALFIFGSICYETYAKESTFPAYVNVEEIIEDLKSKVDLCKQNGVKIIGLQCYNSLNYSTSKSYTIRVIEEIVPLMDSLMVFYNLGDFPELGDRFIEVGKENGIPIEYFTDSEGPLNSYSEGIPVLSMIFGK